MSQHVFEVNTGVECLVGWDPPMQTFFAQVYKVDEDGERIDAEEGGTIIWVGRVNSEIRTVRELAMLIELHAIIPLEIYEALLEIELD